VVNNKFNVYAGYNPPTDFKHENNTLSVFHAGVNYLFGSK